MKLKRIMAMVLCVAMVLSTMGTVVFAEEVITVNSPEAFQKALETVNGGEVIELAEGEFNFTDTTSITVEKPITIKGAGKDATTLKFNSATSAFVIASSGVTFSDMTITQGTQDNSFHISISKGAWNAPAVQYSDVTVKNINFVGGKYSLCLIGEDVVVDSCEFTNQDSHNIIIYSVKGDSKITNNVFNASLGNNKSAILYEGGADNATDLSGFIGGGALTIDGNKAYGKGVFFQFTNWKLVKGLGVSITNNKIDAFTNKAIAIYDMDGALTAEGDEFASVVISENVFTNVPSGRPIIKEYTGKVDVDASRNYLGSDAPALDELIVGDKVTVQSYYSDEALTELVSVSGEGTEYNVAKIGEQGYETLAKAAEAAEAGDTITVIADIADVAISVNKNLTITGNVSANNVTINAVEGCSELTVSGLSFTGNSWINSGAADKLTVSGVTANVTPSNTNYTNSRSAFISLGKSEQKELELVVENCNIVSAGGSNPILGWATITKATITGNTFGSASAYQTNSDSVKFMAIADGATFAIKGNTVYSNYNGFVFAQNTTRGNAYTAVIEDNDFYGSADHVWIEVSGTTTTHATILATSDNTVNNEAFTANDIKALPNITTWTAYAGVDVETDEDGKVIGGQLAFAADDAIAEGYEKDDNGNIVLAPITEYKVATKDELKEALATVKDGIKVRLTADITVDEALTIPEGVEVMIDEGKTLRVLDTLTNNGTISGAGIVSVDVMVYVVETVNPYDNVSYNKTATKNGAINDNEPVCDVTYEISLDGGATWFADTTNGKAQAVTVKTDGTKTVSASFQSAFTTAKTDETVHMLRDAHVQSSNTKKNNGPLRSYYGLILEGNGHTIYTDLESSGASNEYATIKFTSYLAGTGPEVNPVLKNVTVDSQKNAKADIDYVSGDVTFTVTMYNVNLLGNCQYANFAMKSPSLIVNKSNVEIYDCTIPSWDAGSANTIDIYSGDYSLSLNNKCTVYGGTYTKDVSAYLADGLLIKDNGDGTYTVVPDPAYGKVAQIGDTYYETLEEAINTAVDGDIIVLLADATLDKTTNITNSITINGNGKKITQSDVFTSNGANAVLDIMDGATVIFDNVKFDAIKDVAIMRTVNANVVIDNCVVSDCTQTVSQGLLRLACGNATITDSKFINNNCEMVISFGYDAANDTDVLTMDGCLFEGNTCTGPAVVYFADGDKGTVTNTKFIDNTVATNGNAATLYMGWGDGFEVSGCLFDGNKVITSHATTKRFASAIFADGCAIKNNIFLENSATRNGEAISTTVAVAAHYGEASVSSNYWNGDTPSYTVEYDRNEVEALDYYTSYDAESGTLADKKKLVVKVGNINYATLAEAFAAVTDGDTITLLDNITISDAWDCRYNGAKFTASVTIDGNGKTLKLTGEVDDKNWNTVFRFEADATVKNLTIDASEATSIQRGISSKGNIIVDNCTLIGNGTSAKRAVIFGEGAGADIVNVTADIKGSTFKGWTYGVSDNQSGKDAKSVSITDSTFDEASVLVSAAETVTFTGNTVTEGYVNISSYTASDTVVVTATGNTIVGTDDEIMVNPDNITADGAFITPVAKIGSKYYETLNKAITKADNGDTITLLADIDSSEAFDIDADDNIILELNGRTISGTDNETGSYGLINIQPGAELTINDAVGTGKITLSATNNRGWNAYSSVISNQRGRLTVNGGTIEHLGGTDMAYGIDNLTNGKGTYAETVINGGTVKSTYRAVRQFLNGVEAQNILIVNGGTIEGDNKSIWMQDPNKNANSGTLTVDEGAVLEGDVYLFVTEGSTEWPVEVSIAASAVKDKVIPANVPSGYEVALNNGYYVVSTAAEERVAEIGGIKYATLQEAIDDSQDGDMITILKDIINGTDVNIKSEKAFTIDLNEHTLSGDIIVGDAEVTFKGNGRVDSNIIGDIMVEGGNFYGTIDGIATASGGSFSKETTVNTLLGYQVMLVGVRKVVIDENSIPTDKVTVKFEAVIGENGKKLPGVFNIVLYPETGKIINEFVSAEFTFENASKTISQADMLYTIVGTDEITAERELKYTNDADALTQKWEFNLNNIDDHNKNDVAEKIVLGTIRFDGYGTLDLAISGGTVHTTRFATNNEYHYVVAGKMTDNDGELVIDQAKIDPADATIAEKKRMVKVNVSFVNDIAADVDADYNDMYVSVSGEYPGYIGETKPLNVISNTEGFAEFEVTVGYRYTITVKGAGYRTARYSTIVDEKDADENGITPALELNFWNNVKSGTSDALAEIETGVSGLSAKNFLAGDIVMDNIIDKYDLSAAISYFGTYELDKDHLPRYAKYDLNRDGKIDSEDIAYVLYSIGE